MNRIIAKVISWADLTKPARLNVKRAQEMGHFGDVSHMQPVLTNIKGFATPRLGLMDGKKLMYIHFPMDGFGRRGDLGDDGWSYI